MLVPIGYHDCSGSAADEDQVDRDGKFTDESGDN
jgi:hypothetical protein